MNSKLKKKTQKRGEYAALSVAPVVPLLGKGRDAPAVSEGEISLLFLLKQRRRKNIARIVNDVPCVFCTGKMEWFCAIKCFQYDKSQKMAHIYALRTHTCTVHLHTFVFVFIILLVRSCLPTTLIKCLKDSKSLPSRPPRSLRSPPCAPPCQPPCSPASQG